MCIHHFVKSDPERGYHDHPWNKALSFILCGRYDDCVIGPSLDGLDERIINKKDEDGSYTTYPRNQWPFNYLNGVGSFHRVMIEEGGDAWTLFAFQKRSKTWAN